MQKVEIFFSDRLKSLRKEKTQIAVAKELQVNQQTYSRWELGDRQPKLQDLASIALHYGVTTDYLLGITDDNGSPVKPNTTLSDKIKRLKTDATEISNGVGNLLNSIDKIVGTL